MFQFYLPVHDGRYASLGPALSVLSEAIGIRVADPAAPSALRYCLLGIKGYSDFVIRGGSVDA